MRCVTGAGLLALVGCNQIFGITPTTEFDAAEPHVVLDWQIATLLASGPNAGAPDPMIRFAPIDPAPKIRIAPIDGSFDQDQATYSPVDGSIAFPHAYLNTTWRLEYTLADGVPHEVQWAPEDPQGHLTVPVFGRIQRDPVPPGGGYQITPSNPPASFMSPRVFTTGLWTEGTASHNGTTVDYDFSSATSLSGAKGRPDPTLGDRALLVDYLDSPINAAGCRVAVGSAALDSAAIQTGVHTTQTPPWNTTSQVVMSDRQANFMDLGRLTSGLGKLESMFNSSASMQLFGVAASTDMPGLSGTSGTPESSKLLVPVIVTLLQCPYNSSLGSLAPAQPPMLDPFPRILHVQLVDSRQVLGVVTLNSGMETVLVAGASGFTMAFPAAIPMQFTLTTPANSVLDLAGASDQVAVGPASGFFELDFVQEPSSDTPLRADYYDVVLHRFDPQVRGGLTTERIYTVTAPKVRIDGALLMPGADYVFEVRSYKGHPQASHGNFAPVDYPYGAAIVFTSTFKAS